MPITEIVITEGGSASVPLSGEFDLRSDLPVTLSLYQDYEWTLKAERSRSNASSPSNRRSARPDRRRKHTATVHVPTGTDMQHNTRSKSCKLGPAGIATMTPDPNQLTSFESLPHDRRPLPRLRGRWSLAAVVPTGVTAEFKRRSTRGRA
ncbi:MAG: hypothetical protein ACLR8Y_08160 [Alistipes indistinctus]